MGGNSKVCRGKRQKVGNNKGVSNRYKMQNQRSYILIMSMNEIFQKLELQKKKKKKNPVIELKETVQSKKNYFTR